MRCLLDALPVDCFAAARLWLWIAVLLGPCSGWVFCRRWSVLGCQMDRRGLESESSVWAAE